MIAECVSCKLRMIISCLHNLYVSAHPIT
jgi:hypothetical protein